MFLKRKFRFVYPVFKDQGKSYGGAKEDRTPDLLLARQALSQLSYGPKLSPTQSVMPIVMGYMVGPSGLEPPTSPLSGVRSNQLS